MKPPRLPRLPLPAERRILKWACELPPRTQRLLYGRPPTVEGQTLASDVHVLITLARLAGNYSYTECRPPEEARRVTRHDAAVAAPALPIPMQNVDDLSVPGVEGPIPVRHYVPAGAGAGAALLVYFHGGGWVVGDLETHDNCCRFLAAASGAQVLSVDFRLSPEHPFPAPVEDAWSSYLWAVENAAALGAAPERIAVGGDSAGGNMAAVVSMVAREEGAPMPAFQLLIYPPTDTARDRRSRHLFADGFLLTRSDMEYFEGLYLPPGTDRTDPRISIVKHPDLGRLPPALVVSAGFDPLRDESEEYGLRMRDAGCQVAIRRFPGLIHGFVNQTRVSRSSRAAMFEIAGALRIAFA